MDHIEVENSLNENGLNQGDRCQITLLDDSTLDAEFIQYVSWYVSDSPYSNYIRAKVKQNKRSYITSEDDKVEYWQEDVKDLSIPIDKIKIIKSL
jgi:hypothetical protein